MEIVPGCYAVVAQSPMMTITMVFLGFALALLDSKKMPWCNRAQQQVPEMIVVPPSVAFPEPSALYPTSRRLETARLHALFD